MESPGTSAPIYFPQRSVTCYSSQFANVVFLPAPFQPWVLYRLRTRFSRKMWTLRSSSISKSFWLPLAGKEMFNYIRLSAPAQIVSMTVEIRPRDSIGCVKRTLRFEIASSSLPQSRKAHPWKASNASPLFSGTSSVSCLFVPSSCQFMVGCKFCRLDLAWLSRLSKFPEFGDVEMEVGKIWVNCRKCVPLGLLICGGGVRPMRARVGKCGGWEPWKVSSPLKWEIAPQVFQPQ